MMVAEIETNQFSLFPEASSSEVQHTKSLLTKYKKIKADIEGFEVKNTTVNNVNLEKAVLIKLSLEKAAALIIDDDVRRIIEYRYIKGYKRKETVLRFLSIMSESTIDRYIDRGIESIASTLKLWKEFS